MPHEIKIMVAFSEETKYGVFRDNIFLTEDEFASLKDSQLEDLKQSRVSTWVDRQEKLPPPYEPTKEDLQAMVEQAKAQQVQLDAALEPLQTKEELQTKLDKLDVQRVELAAKLKGKK